MDLGFVVVVAAIQEQTPVQAFLYFSHKRPFNDV